MLIQVAPRQQFNWSTHLLSLMFARPQIGAAQKILPLRPREWQGGEFQKGTRFCDAQGGSQKPALRKSAIKLLRAAFSSLANLLFESAPIGLYIIE
jgi:hypothetical protein